MYEEENKSDVNNIEEVEADVINEGKKAMTMEDIPESERSEFDGKSASENSGASAEQPNMSYEQQVYVESNTKVFGILSLVLGIFSVVCCCVSIISLILGVASIVLGILSIKKEPDMKTVAIIGIVCGGIGTGLALISMIFVGLLETTSEIFDSVFGLDQGLIDKFGNM